MALWQTAPNPVSVDSTGRIQGVFGFGQGTYEDVRVSCEGQELGTSEVGFEGYGGQIDTWPIRDVRLTGFGGSLTATWRSGGSGGPAGITVIGGGP